jgi:rubrerythrin
MGEQRVLCPECGFTVEAHHDQCPLCDGQLDD